MPGFWRNCERRFLLLAMILVLAVLVAVNLGLAMAYWHDSETSAAIRFKTGTWGHKPLLHKLCPCYGVNSVRTWAVFIEGSNLKQVTGVKLVRMTRVVKAKKVWPLSDGLLYCVFDLRGMETGAYDIVLMVNGRKTTVVSSAFKIYESGYWVSAQEPDAVSGQPSDCSSSSPVGLTDADSEQGAQKPEDPRDFKVDIVGRNDVASLVLEVRGPLRSKFRSALLVRKNGIFQGSVFEITQSGCTAGFKEVVPPGAYDLVLIKSDDSNLLLENSVVLRTAVEQTPVLPVAPSIVLAGVEPGNAIQGKTVELTVAGEHLEGCNWVALVNGTTLVEPTDVPVKSQTRMTCLFDLSGAPPGTYDLAVCATDGSKATLPGCFIIVAQSDLIPPTTGTQPVPPTTPMPEEKPTRGIW